MSILWSGPLASIAYNCLLLLFWGKISVLSMSVRGFLWDSVFFGQSYCVLKYHACICKKENYMRALTSESKPVLRTKIVKNG